MHMENKAAPNSLPDEGDRVTDGTTGGTVTYESPMGIVVTYDDGDQVDYSWDDAASLKREASATDCR
jgi:hypothetical protein